MFYDSTRFLGQHLLSKQFCHVATLREGGKTTTTIIIIITIVTFAHGSAVTRGPTKNF